MTLFSFRAAGRLGWLIVPLLLAACASGPTNEMPTAVAAPAPAAAPAPDNAAPAPAARSSRTARNARSAPAATEPEEDPGPMTHARASGECWMKYEKGHPSLEVREKLVGKCIEEKMNAAGKQ